MRTVVVQGGWRVWALIIVGGAVLIALTLMVGVLMLGALVVGAVLFAGHRLMQMVGLADRRAPIGQRSPATGAGDDVIDAEFHVVTPTVERLSAPRE